MKIDARGDNVVLLPVELPSKRRVAQMQADAGLAAQAGAAGMKLVE